MSNVWYIDEYKREKLLIRKYVNTEGVQKEAQLVAVAENHPMNKCLLMQLRQNMFYWEAVTNLS